jgi:hypothetical protein
MNAQPHFNPIEKRFVGKCFSRAERLTGRFFEIFPKEWLAERYDVRTRVELERHEVRETAFAHLCKYSLSGDSGVHPREKPYFYRVCLQDDRILDAIKRGNSFIKLAPLLLYIATHELVHILRFERGESDFDMPIEERTKEEQRVDAITRDILIPWAGREMSLVLDCFGSSYRIGDSSN